MKTSFHPDCLNEMDYHVRRLNRLGFACIQQMRIMKPNEFVITTDGQTYTVETCGDFGAVLPKCVDLNPK